MRARRRKIRNYLINKKFQLRYVLFLVLSSLLALSIHTFVFFFFVKENYDILVELAPLTDDVYNELQEELVKIAIVIASTGVGFAVLVSIIGIIFSHRAAGPLFNIQNVCKKIQGGESSARIRLRPNDEFRSIAIHLNAAFDCLQYEESEKYIVSGGSGEFSGVVLPHKILEDLYNSKSIDPSTKIKKLDVSNADEVSVESVFKVSQRN